MAFLPSVCQYCGRQNETTAQFCSDCGKPLTKAAAARAAISAGGIREGGGGGGSRGEPGHVVSRTSGPPSPDNSADEAPCPVCGTVVTPHGPERRFIPDRRGDHSVSLVLMSEMATEVQRFERRHTATTIGRSEGDIRFPD